jgi:hypothetical protein
VQSLAVVEHSYWLEEKVNTGNWHQIDQTISSPSYSTDQGGMGNYAAISKLYQGDYEGAKIDGLLTLGAALGARGSFAAPEAVEARAFSRATVEEMARVIEWTRNAANEARVVANGVRGRASEARVLKDLVCRRYQVCFDRRRGIDTGRLDRYSINRSERRSVCEPH